MISKAIKPSSRKIKRFNQRKAAKSHDQKDPNNDNKDQKDPNDQPLTSEKWFGLFCKSDNTIKQITDEIKDMDINQLLGIDDESKLTKTKCLHLSSNNDRKDHKDRKDPNKGDDYKIIIYHGSSKTLKPSEQKKLQRLGANTVASDSSLSANMVASYLAMKFINGPALIVSENAIDLNDLVKMVKKTMTTMNGNAKMYMPLLKNIGNMQDLLNKFAEYMKRTPSRGIVEQSADNAAPVGPVGPVGPVEPQVQVTQLLSTLTSMPQFKTVAASMGASDMKEIPDAINALLASKTQQVGPT